ncbi:MAG TPA: DsbA family oxidoreductase [Candidatus Acidoferrum sp.]|nr:DsbA family oxidoreductase [Candidatus Acidoferrum sp.]
MILDVFSDTICPWCYIGKRRLERALEARPQRGLKVRWRAFQLNPGMPAEGMDRKAYIDAKFGGAERARAILDTVRTAGAGEGIAFAFDRIRRTPSTLQSHRLIRFAGNQERQDEAVDALFRAYFLEGRNIGDRAVLADVAEEAGLDRSEAADYLAGDADAEAVLGEDTLARRAGINGVPCFIFNGRFALSGAQEPEAFFQLFDLAREEEQVRSEAMTAAS